MLGIQILLCHLIERLPLHRIPLGRSKVQQLVTHDLYLSLNFRLLLDRESRPREKRQRTLRLVLLLYATLGTGTSLLPIRSHVLRVWVLDIDQDNSTIIKQGSRYITINGGSTLWPDYGKRVMEPFLMSRALGVVGAVLLTHTDLDRMSGLSYFASRGSGVRVERVILSPAVETNPHYAKLVTSFGEDPETELFFMGVGDVYGDFHCLQLPREALPGEVSEQSLILLLTVNDERYLSTGDTGQPSEEKLLERSAAPRRTAECAALMDIDPLEVEHHGSRGAGNGALPTLLSPSYALVSCGWGNPYRHPYVETVERLRRHAGQVHSTAREGALSAELLPN